MLVGYSSSSEEEEGVSSLIKEGQEDSKGTDGYPAKKKPKVEDQPAKTSRLPLPHSLLNMFPDELVPQTEDSSLHGGRIRSFKHERGNWATYVYLTYLPDEEFSEILEGLMSAAKTHGIVLTPQEEFHLSLSQTVVLRHHWIQPFTQSLKAGLAHCKRFMCSAGKLRVYCNAEKTRTFLGIEVSAGHTQLQDLVKVVDKTMTDFQLETFYKDPSFHVSLAWCIGEMTAQMNAYLEEFQSILDDHVEGPFSLCMECVELHCQTGNKTFRFALQS